MKATTTTATTRALGKRPRSADNFKKVEGTPEQESALRQRLIDLPIVEDDDSDLSELVARVNAPCPEFDNLQPVRLKDLIAAALAVP